MPEQSVSEEQGNAAPPRVLGIIVTWNRKDHVQRLLGEVASLDRGPDEIVVVDNASSDGTVEVLREAHPEVHVVANATNLGGTGGFNAGLRWGLERGGFDYFWLMDNDIHVHPGALQAMLSVLEARPDAALAGSRLGELQWPGRTQEVGARVDWETGTLLKLGTEEEHPAPESEAPPRIYEADYVASCSLLARVTAIEKVGIWDPIYFVFFDDIDWGVRFTRAGWKVLGVETSFVEHDSFWERRLVQNARGNYLCSRNGLYFFHRFTPPEHRVGLLRRIFRAMLMDVCHFRAERRTALAKVVEAALTDFFLGRFGDPLRRTFEDPPLPGIPVADPSAGAAAVPARHGRILLWTLSASSEMREAAAEIRRCFPEHTVDLFVPPNMPEINIGEIGPYVQKPIGSFSERRKTARWIRENYDAVAVDHMRGRLFLSMAAPCAVWYTPDGRLSVTRNRWTDRLMRAAAKPVYEIGSWALALAALCKPRRRVDYHAWRN